MKTKFSFPVGLYITNKYNNKRALELIMFRISVGFRYNTYEVSFIFSSISIQMRNDIGDDKNEDSL